MANQKKSYLYLTRRDKKGIKLLMTFPSKTDQPPVRVSDVKQLFLPESITAKVKEEVSTNRMTHELWIESADSYQDLKAKLTKRGYTGLPINQTIIIMMEDKKPLGAKLPEAKASMMRRGSHERET